VPYVCLLTGPELAAWWENLPPGARPPIAKALLVAAAASHLKRELAVHAVRGLSPAAGACLAAAANVAAAVALVALAA